MKPNKFKYAVLISLILIIVSCQKNKIEVAAAQLPPVINLSYTLTGDSVLLTWTLPSGYSSLGVNISDGTSLTQLPANSTSYKYGIVITNKKYTFTVKLTDGKGNTSLGQTVSFTRTGAAPVKNVSGVQNDNGVLLTWTSPDLPVTKITIKFGNQTIDLGPSAISYQFNNVPVGTYLITFVTTNSLGQVSNTVYLSFKVGATMVAYLGEYADSTTLLNTADDDRVAGAKWLFSTYPKSRYLSFAQVKNGSVDLSQIRVIWWNFDIESGHALPAAALDPTVVSKLTNFYKAGGNFLLNQYAIQYFWTMGRMTFPYFMGFDEGTGFDNPDTWGVGVNIHGVHNQSSHPIYSGITMTTQGDGRVTFPVIGPGWKENHNAVIVRIPEYYGGLPNDNELAYTKFTTDNNLEWLGMWDGIGDYYMSGVMELKPKDTFQGSGIYIGIGGIEWKQNSGTNLYQANIEKLYKNSIDYLKTK